jgi:hypothetical protein
MNTEDIFWLSIKDIENGNAKTLEEDPIEGFLNGNNKKLTKKNVCDQTAKYNNGKAFSRPTLDSYSEIALYIAKTKPTNNISIIKEKEKKANEKVNNLKEVITQLEEDKKNLAFENYKLQERIKFLENK